MSAALQRIFAQLAARARRGHKSQLGFTLVEVVASVVILGIIMVPLGTAMAVGFRSVFSQQQQLGQSSDVEQLSAYFPGDVQSVDATGVNPTDSNNVAVCAADPLKDETSLITFVWDEDLGISGQTMARYIAEGSGKTSKIIRRFCRGAADPSQPASASNDWTDITLASHFGTDAVPVQNADHYTITTDSAAPVPNGTTPQCDAKSCFIEIHGAYDYRLSANRRVPGVDPDARPPDAPTDVHGVPGNHRVTLYWTDGSDNGSSLTSYTIETTPGAAVLYPAPATSGTSGVQIDGLTNATSYKFRVRATNSAGNSAYSGFSDVIVPGPTTPDPPTIGTATPSPTVNGSIALTWSIPPLYNDGGAVIVGYRIYALEFAGRAGNGRRQLCVGHERHGDRLEGQHQLHAAGHGAERLRRGLAVGPVERGADAAGRARDTQRPGGWWRELSGADVLAADRWRLRELHELPRAGDGSSGRRGRLVGDRVPQRCELHVLRHGERPGQRHHLHDRSASAERDRMGPAVPSGDRCGDHRADDQRLRDPDRGCAGGRLTSGSLPSTWSTPTRPTPRASPRSRPTSTTSRAARPRCHSRLPAVPGPWGRPPTPTAART